MHYMAVYSACRGNELGDKAIPFIAALNYHSPGIKLHLHIVDPPKEFKNIIQAIQQRATALTLSFSFKASSYDSSITPHVGKQLLAFLKKAPYDVLYIDIDFIVKKPLFVFLSVFHQTQIAYSNDNASAQLPKLLWLRSHTSVYTGLKQLGNLPFTHLIKQSPDTAYQIIDNTLYDYAFFKTASDKNKTQLSTEWFSTKYIAIICRRIDLPFDKTIIPTRQRAIQNLKSDSRLYWQAFPLLLRKAYAINGIYTDLYCLPHGQITQAFVKTLPHKIIYVPHKNSQQIDDKRTQFYMQDIYPWFFTIDTQGWGPTHSKRGKGDYLLFPINLKIKQLKTMITSKKITKYTQTTTSLPNFDVFFPLQVPNDESLQFGTADSLIHIVKTVVRWAMRYRVCVLFKAHPMAKNAFSFLLKIRSPFIKFIYEGNIHDILERAKSVFVANSSVGFEALLYDKPIVTFANSIYDEISIQATLDINTIQSAYLHSQQSPLTQTDALKWLSWYLFEAGVPLIENPACIPLHTQQKTRLSHQLKKEIHYLTHIQSPGVNRLNHFLISPFFNSASIIACLRKIQSLYNHMKHNHKKTVSNHDVA